MRVGLRRCLRASCYLVVSIVGYLEIASASPFTATMYFTDFSSHEISRIGLTYDGAGGLTTSGQTVIATTPGADGIVFTSDGFLAIGGQGNAVYRVNPTTGAYTTQTAGGTAAFHMMVAPNGTIWSSGIPGTPAHYNSTLTNNGTAVPLAGDDLFIDSISWTGSDSTEGFYTSSGAGGHGNFGTIDLTTASTTRIYSGLEAAHGMTYDPYTGNLILFGDSHITQIDPVSHAIVSDYFQPGSSINFDQGTVDGKGHIFAASNDGNLVLIDYSVSKKVGAPDFTPNVVFLTRFLDDIAPLVGPGSSPVPEPASAGLLLSGGLLALVQLRRRLRK